MKRGSPEARETEDEDEESSGSQADFDSESSGNLKTAWKNSELLLSL